MFGFLYSLIAYVGFLAAFNYFIFFTNGVWVPKHVDTGEPGSLGLALAANLGLILLWGVQHSVMARQGFKRWLTRFVPKHLERATFVLASALTLGAVMLLWQPVGGQLWQVESPVARNLLWVVNGLGWAGVPVVSFLIDHFDLFGLKQAWTHWRQRSYGQAGFVTPWLYRYVRHPMMSAFFVAFWACPTMSVSHALFSLCMSIYIVVGVHFEERSLRRELGIPYGDYQARTPKFVPGLAPTRAAEPARSQAELG